MSQMISCNFVPDNDNEEHRLRHVEGKARHSDILDVGIVGIVIAGSRPQSFEVAVQGGPAGHALTFADIKRTWRPVLFSFCLHRPDNLWMLHAPQVVRNNAGTAIWRSLLSPKLASFNFL